MSTLIRNLKNLFKSFIYYRSEDENQFHQRITGYVTYKDGIFKNKYNGKQVIQVEFYGHRHNTYTSWFVGYFKGNITPGVVNQTIVLESTSTKSTVTTDENGYFQTNNPNGLWIESNDSPNVHVTITAKPITVNGEEYKGTTLIHVLED